MFDYRDRHFSYSPYSFRMSQESSNKHFGIWYCPVFPISQPSNVFSYFGKNGFNSKVSYFFSDYLVDRSMQFPWSNFVSSFFNVDVDIGLLYIKSTYSEDMSPQWCCPLNIYKTSLSFVIAILFVTCLCDDNATICISSIL